MHKASVTFAARLEVTNAAAANQISNSLKAGTLRKARETQSSSVGLYDSFMFIFSFIFLLIFVYFQNEPYRIVQQHGY